MFNSNKFSFFLSNSNFSPTCAFFLSIRTTNTGVLVYVHVYATTVYCTVKSVCYSHNTIQYSFYYNLTFTGDGSCLDPIDITLSAINGQNMNITVYNCV